MKVSYRRIAAVQYALKYIQYPNPFYPNWEHLGGDCANFISQCLHAGGQPMKGSPDTTKTAEDWNNWFSRGSRPSIVNVSSTWRGAQAFRDYWQRHASESRFFNAMDIDSYNYAQIGDVISLLNSAGFAYHTLIIVEKQKLDFKVAAHTDSYIKNGKPYFFGERPLESGFIVYKFL